MLLKKGHMTGKQAGVIINRALGLSLSESALRAGYRGTSRHSLASSASNVIERHLRPGSEFSKVLAKCGIDMNRLAEALRRLMDCKTTVRVGPDHVEEIPDNKVQLEVCRLLARILGVELPKKPELEKAGGDGFAEKLIELAQSG